MRQEAAPKHLEEEVCPLSAWLAVGSCQKPEGTSAAKPLEKKCDEKKAAPKPAPIKSAAPVCKKK